MRVCVRARELAAETKMRPKHELTKTSERVNTLLREEAISLRLGTKKSLRRLDECKSNMTAFSHWAELEFREYVRRQIEHRAGSASALIIGGARLLGLSPATTKRYMEKLRTKGGPFSGLGDIIVINPNFQPRENDSYWQDVTEPDAGEQPDA